MILVTSAFLYLLSHLASPESCFNYALDNSVEQTLIPEEPRAQL